MIWFRTWRLGVKSLLLHPMRSSLTVLGIFIGVASVIWLLAIGEGISQEAQRQIEGLGANNIIVRSIKPPDEASAGMRGPIPYGLKRADFDRLISTISTIDSALPIRELRRQVLYQDRSADCRLVGCTPEYAEATQLVIDRGRYLSHADILNRHTYCVLAGDLAERLFPYEDPIGHSVYFPEHKDFYTVVGVLMHRDPTAAIGGSLAAQDFSSDIYIPITTLRKRIGDIIVTRRSGSFEGEILELNQITLRVDSIKNVKRTAELVDLTLANHDEMSDVAIVVPKELLEQAERTRIMFMLFMGLIAAISLLVGGIGIMNIMLATVTERTREIGVRRALGARRADIIRQFLVETVALSIVGGITGICGGVSCLPLIQVIRWLFEKYAAETMASLPDLVRNVDPIIVPESIPIAFFISVLVGVVFGIYPAIRAADMDPIEALRHE